MIHFPCLPPNQNGARNRGKSRVLADSSLVPANMSPETVERVGPPLEVLHNCRFIRLIDLTSNRYFWIFWLNDPAVFVLSLQKLLSNISYSHCCLRQTSVTVFEVTCQSSGHFSELLFSSL